MGAKKSSEIESTLSGESEKLATPSIAQKKIRRVGNPAFESWQVPLYARKYYVMALLDVVNYLESTSDSASLYGMNSLKGATSLIKEMLKKPDELFYYKNYAQIPVPEEYEKKFLLKMVDNVIEKRKLQMESAYPCCKCGHEAVLEDWKDRCRVRCSYCSTTGIDVSKSVYPDNADAVAVYMWNRNKNCVGSKTAKEMKKRVKSPV